jgi:short-subunit dehydrogenase
MRAWYVGQLELEDPIMALHSFADRTVVITGASAGIGAATARQFADHGANLVLAARGADALDTLARELGPRAQVLTVPTDVADVDACLGLLTQAVERFGALHVLVNNAAANNRGPVEGCTPADLAHLVDVNLRAPIALSCAAVPLLRQAGGGAIINVASLAGRIPLADEATYSATKFGLRAFSLAMAEELADSGITVSVVSPGPVDTQFLMDNMEHVPDKVFSQPMSTADTIASLIVQCALDGKLERAWPRVSGYLATIGYLSPRLTRALAPMLERHGRKQKERYRRNPSGNRS